MAKRDKVMDECDTCLGSGTIICCDICGEPWDDCDCVNDHEKNGLCIDCDGTGKELVEWCIKCNRDIRHCQDGLLHKGQGHVVRKPITCRRCDGSGDWEDMREPTEEEKLRGESQPELFDGAQ